MPSDFPVMESIKASVDFSVESSRSFRFFNRSSKECLSLEEWAMVSERRCVTLNKQMIQMEKDFMRIEEVSRGTKLEIAILRVNASLRNQQRLLLRVELIEAIPN